RPLIADEHGRWLRGDVVRVPCAQFLGANAVATPISCNPVAELCGAFSKVERTRIGSPYLTEQLQAQPAQGYHSSVAYDANGGFLRHDALAYARRVLSPLPARDALLPIVTRLVAARSSGSRLAQQSQSLPQRVTASDRVQPFPTEESGRLIEGHSTTSSDG